MPSPGRITLRLLLLLFGILRFRLLNVLLECRWERSCTWHGGEFSLLVQCLECVQADPDHFGERTLLLIEVWGSEESALVFAWQEFFEAVSRKVDVLHVKHGPGALVEHLHINNPGLEGIRKFAQAFAVMRPLPQIQWQRLAQPCFHPHLHVNVIPCCVAHSRPM